MTEDNLQLYNTNESNLITPEDKQESNKNSYSPMLNAKGSNGLITLPVTSKAIKARFTYSPETEEGSLFTKDDLKVTIANYDNITHLGNSVLFLLYTLKEYTKTVPAKKNSVEYKRFRAGLVSRDSRTVAINFENYLDFFNIPNTPDNRKNAKRNLKEYFNTLKNVNFEFTDYSISHKKYLNYSLALFSGTAEEADLSEIKRSGDIYFIYNLDFIDYLTENNFITYIADKSFTMDLIKHPNALAINFKLSVMYSMNFWKNNKGLISVEALLADVLNIPSYEEVKKLQKSPYNAIIEPLERDLNYLQDYGIISNWEYCNEKREPLTDEQLEKYNYKALSKCYIKYALADYPEDKQQERKKRLEEKAQKKEKKPVKSKKSK